MAVEAKDLVPIEGEFQVVRPLVSAEKALATWNEYQGLVQKIVGPTDIQTFTEDGKKRSFIKKSGWQKLATYYGISVEMVDERLFHKHDAKTCLRAQMPDKFGDVIDCGCAVVGARYVVRAMAPNGRRVEAVGLATFNEKRARYTRVEHDLAGKAYTRAVNRAISAMVGAGEISAEEARSTGEVAGLPEEDRRAIKDAWVAAPADRRDYALTALREWGFEGADVRALFTDLNRRGDETAVADLLAILREMAAERFDPDEVPGS